VWQTGAPGRCARERADASRHTLLVEPLFTRTSSAPQANSKRGARDCLPASKAPRQLPADACHRGRY
jgi:hypothetical protein